MFIGAVSARINKFEYCVITVPDILLKTYYYLLKLQSINKTPEVIVAKMVDDDCGFMDD